MSHPQSSAPRWRGPALVLAAVGAVFGALALLAFWPQLRTGALISDLERPERRLVASQRLIELGPQAVPALIEVASDPAHPARGDAVELLGRIGDPRAVPALVAVEDPALQRVRIEALAGLRGEEALRAVVARLGDPDPELELSALAALEDWPDPQGAQAALLVPYLAHQGAGYRLHAARGLGHRRHAPAVPALMAHLDDPAPAVREAAAWALLQVGTPQAVQAVEAARARGAVTFEE